MKFEESDIDDLRPLLKQFAAELLDQQSRKPAVDDRRIAYTEPEAAGLIGLRAHQLREQRRLGRITACNARPGKRVLYTRAEIERFLATDWAAEV